MPEAPIKKGSGGREPPSQKSTPPDRCEVRGRESESAGQRSQSKSTKHRRVRLGPNALVTAAPGEIGYRHRVPAAEVAAFERRSIGFLRRAGLPIVDGMVLEPDWLSWREERGEAREANVAHARDEGV